MDHESEINWYYCYFTSVWCETSTTWNQTSPHTHWSSN